MQQCDEQIQLHDFRGIRCPITLLKIKQQMLVGRQQTCHSLPYAAKFWFDDPGAAQDLPLWVAQHRSWRLQWYLREPTSFIAEVLVP